MNESDIINHYYALTTAQQALYYRAEKEIMAHQALDDKRSALAGAVDGKNAEIRKAQVDALTVSEENDYRNAAAKRRNAQHAASQAQLAVDCDKLLVRLLSIPCGVRDPIALDDIPDSDAALDLFAN